MLIVWLGGDMVGRGWGWMTERFRVRMTERVIQNRIVMIIH